MWIIALIFKILLWTIAIIIATIIIALIIVFITVALIPIRYHIKADNNSEEVKVNAKITYFLGFIGYNYYYENGQEDGDVIFFWHKSLFFDRLAEKIEKKSQKKKIKNKHKKQNLKKDNKKKKDNLKEKDYNDEIKDEIYKDRKTKTFKSRKHIVGNTIRKIKREYKAITTMPNKKEIFKLVLKLIKDFSKACKNKIFKIWIKFGFDDPSETGIWLGLGSMVSAMIINGVQLEPDFEKETFLIDVEIKGKTTALALLLPLIKFVMQKPILNLILDREDD